MSRKQYFIILDTETMNTLEQPLPYDIGWVVCDKYGKIYEERSFVIAETFFDMSDVMQSAYYAEKIPQYYKDLSTHKRKAKGFWNIRKQLLADMKKYKTNKVGAYNMAFDKRALNNLIRYVSKSWKRWFFPYGTEFFCVWSMACDTILNRKSYIDFVEKNGFISPSGNVQTSAEIAYRYLTDKIDFIESHTGLEDCKIEAEIMAYCYRQHTKMSKDINPGCWRKVQRKRKELDLRTVFK